MQYNVYMPMQYSLYMFVLYNYNIQYLQYNTYNYEVRSEVEINTHQRVHEAVLIIWKVENRICQNQHYRNSDMYVHP